MSISFDDFSHLEVLILSGAVDAIRQQEFFSVLRVQPNLARDYDEDGTSLLMVAADAGNRAAIEALCNMGANVNAKSDCGETALENAVRREWKDESEGEIRYEMVQLLLEHGAYPNLIGSNGCNALHWAVIEGDPATVELLLRYKADVDLCTDDRNPMTAMDIVQSGRSWGTVARREVIAGLLAKAERRKYG
ncbi:hypothetical protein MCAMS1_01734 [biofilm metagenome]